MIPVLMADDETLIRTAMATMLGLEDDLEVVEHVSSGAELVDSWRRRVESEEPVAVAILELQMPGLNGIDTAREVLALTPDAGVLIVTTADPPTSNAPSPPASAASSPRRRRPRPSRRSSGPCTQADVTSTPSSQPRQSARATRR